jgi:DNA-binding beta-propeller fold protein YncE
MKLKTLKICSFIAIAERAAVILGVLLCGIGSPAQSDDSNSYKVLKSVRVGGEGGFDYLSADVEARRLYVPRSGSGGRLTVWDLDTLAPVGEIPGVASGGAVADSKSGHGFSTTMPVTMWDSKTLKPIKTIDVQSRPDGILFDPYKARVWVFSHGVPQATVIDAIEGTVVGSIDLGGAAEQAVTDGHGKVYVNLTDKSTIAVIDANQLAVTARYDLSGTASNAGGLAFDAKNHILFSYLHQPSSMAVIVNADTGKIITTLPTGEGVDTAGFDPTTMEAFSAQRDGTMTIIKERSPTDFVVEQNLKTMPGAKTLAMDTKLHRAIVISAEFGPAPSPPPSGGRGGRRPMLPGSFTILMVGK